MRDAADLDRFVEAFDVVLGVEGRAEVAESQPWSAAEWVVALRFDIPRATVQVLVLG